jgi:hypothetical protein
MKITFRWLTFLAFTVCLPAWAGQAGLTLEEAVAKVQHDTGGKVLSADTRKVGKTTEYRLKVLTPDGHVRVVVQTSETAKIPDPSGRDTKEKD